MGSSYLVRKQFERYQGKVKKPEKRDQTLEEGSCREQQLLGR